MVTTGDGLEKCSLYSWSVVACSFLISIEELGNGLGAFVLFSDRKGHLLVTKHSFGE